MKPIFSFFCIAFLILLLCNVSYGRKELEQYWENSMKGQAMPEVIKNLVVQNLPSVSPDAEKDRFVRDFDIRPNVILYHTHVVSKQEEMKQKKMKMKKPFVQSLVEAERNLMFKLEEAMAEQTVKKGG